MGQESGRATRGEAGESEEGVVGEGVGAWDHVKRDRIRGGEKAK